jgi:hypothetical protein
MPDPPVPPLELLAIPPVPPVLEVVVLVLVELVELAVELLVPLVLDVDVPVDPVVDTADDDALDPPPVPPVIPVKSMSPPRMVRHPDTVSAPAATTTPRCSHRLIGRSLPRPGSRGPPAGASPRQARSPSGPSPPGQTR